jgi:EmrB/QacA subfamily drug resistance transporter
MALRKILILSASKASGRRPRGEIPALRQSPSPDAVLLSRARRRWVVAACSAGMFMSAVEATIVATAMPTIVGVLGGFHLFSWVFAVYVLAQCVTIPIYGRLADLYGRKRVYTATALLFVAGSALCGISTNMTMLIVFRAIQGIGAGGVLPIATTIVGDIYSAEDRARIQGYLSTIWGVSAVLGPLLGAILVRVSWQTIFWINIPVGLFSAAVLVASLKERPVARRHRVDYLGSILLVLGTGALILALIDWSRLGSVTVALLIAVSAALMALLLRHERRSEEPMLPLDLWNNRVVSASLLGALAIGAVMMGVSAFMPTYVQGVMGRTPLQAGFALSSMSISWTISSAVVGWLILRTSYRSMAIAGGITLVIGSLVLVALEPARGPVWATAGASLVGFGMGFSNTTFLVAAQSSVEHNRRGIATSLSVFMRLFGQSLGAAVSGGIVNFALAGTGSDASTLVDRLMQPELRQGLGADDLAQLTHAVAGALHDAYLLMAAMALVALALAFALPAGLNPRRTR